MDVRFAYDVVANMEAKAQEFENQARQCRAQVDLCRSLTQHVESARSRAEVAEMKGIDQQCRAQLSLDKQSRRATTAESTVRELTVKLDNVQNELYVAKRRAETAEFHVADLQHFTQRAFTKMQEQMNNETRRAEESENKVRELTSQLDRVGDQLKAATMRAETAELKIADHEHFTQCAHIKMQQEIEREMRRAEHAEDRLLKKDETRRMENVKIQEPRSAPQLDNDITLPRRETRTGHELWQLWPCRVMEIVQKVPGGIPLSSFNWHWEKCFPKEKMADFQPIRQLKRAVMNYVDEVEVIDDTVRLKSSSSVHSGQVVGRSEISRPVGSTVRTRSRSASRSRSPRRRSWSPRRRRKSPEDVELVQHVLGAFKEMLGALEERNRDPRPSAGARRPFHGKPNILRSFSKDAWRLDPSQRPEAAADWCDAIRTLRIDTLNQSHDTVAQKFAHGPHAGQTVTSLTDDLCKGRVAPTDWPLMVVARHKENGRDGLWVVFGNRRLKVMRSARRRGWATEYVNCIVHDFDERSNLCPNSELLCFFCKYLLARTNEDVTEAEFRPRVVAPPRPAIGARAWEFASLTL